MEVLQSWRLRFSYKNATIVLTILNALFLLRGFLSSGSSRPKLSLNDPNSDLEISKMSAAVIKKFFIASMFMWMLPVAILYGFNHNLIPGLTDLSPYSLTLVSGFLAVISVNIVLAFYVYMAMKEPSVKPEPDPKFLADAKASVKKLTAEVENNSSQALKKEE